MKGIKTIDGRAAYELDFKTAGEMAFRRFFDRSSHLLIMQHALHSETKTVTRYEYQEVNGIKYFSKILDTTDVVISEKNKKPKTIQLKLEKTITDIVIDSDLSDKLFERPSG